MNTTTDGNYMGKALDIATRLAVVAAILFGSYRVFSPFLMVMIWATVISVAVFPLFMKMKTALGGRTKTAGALFVVLTLAMVLVPVTLLTESLLDATVGIVNDAKSETLTIPPPTERVKTWPLIGERTYEFWMDAHENLRGTMSKLQPQLRNLGESVVSGVSELGKAIIQTILAIIIAGILMATSQAGASAVDRVAWRLGGAKGPETVNLMVDTIRSVVKGVVLVAVIQGLLAAVGLVVAGVPGAGLWALLVMIVSAMQLPAILVMGPIIPYVFAHGDSTVIAVLFTIWAVIVTLSDNVLKAVLLGRGVEVPMLVILIGAIGGMLGFGIIGLFVGAVVLAVFYVLFQDWIKEVAGPTA